MVLFSRGPVVYSPHVRPVLAMRGDDENDHSNNDAEDPEVSVDTAMQWSGVRIGFWWHRAGEGYSMEQRAKGKILNH